MKLQLENTCYTSTPFEVGLECTCILVFISIIHGATVFGKIMPSLDDIYTIIITIDICVVTYLLLTYIFEFICKLNILF